MRPTALSGRCCGWWFGAGLLVPDRGRRWHHGDDPLDDLGRGDVVGHGVEAEHDAVRHHVLGHRLHVGGQHVVPAVDQRQRAGGGDQAQRGSRAAADLDDRGEVGQVELGGRTRRQHQPDDVLGDEVVDEDLLGLTLQLEDQLRVQAPGWRSAGRRSSGGGSRTPRCRPGRARRP